MFVGVRSSAYSFEEFMAFIVGVEGEVKIWILNG